MIEKVYVAEDKTAVFVCPECGKKRTMNLSSYKNLDKSSKVTCKCACGHSYPVILEKRRFFRKKTDLAATYTYVVSNLSENYCEEVGKGMLKIKDISRTGLQLELNKPLGLKKGDKFSLEFTLDDQKRTLIKKEVVIRKIDANLMGVEFLSSDPGDPGDKALGFYLF